MINTLKSELSIQEQKKLGNALWKIAEDLRGSMNTDDFRDYMLSFLCLRYLSDNYEAVAKKELGTDTPLTIWYKGYKEDVPEFEKQMRRKVHYVIRPDFLWSSMIELARTQSEDLLKTLIDGFKYIENASFASTFQGLFSQINLNSEKLGKTYTERNAKLCTIITKIADSIAQFPINNNTLNNAYTYLIEQFAAGSGKKAGEFYTPQQISSILSAIVILDSQDPSTGKKKKLEKVLDFACGSGSLLLNVRHQFGSRSIGKMFGQEKSVTTYNLARMNMLLHGVKAFEFELFRGDSLLNEWDILRETNPAKQLRFDAVVANPPPNSFAFLLHGLHYLDKQGTMAIVLPYDVLSRSGTEERIRRKLLKDGNIDTVIGLPANLFPSTDIPVCILVLKKCKKPDDVLFINASEHLDKIIATYQFRQEEEHYARCVSMDEIETNGYNLHISRYISTAKADS